MGAIAAGVIAAGAAAGTTYLSGAAKKAALHEQKEALRNLQFVDVDAYRKTAFRSDRQEFLNRFKIFRRADPKLSAVRDQSISNLLTSLEGEDANVEKIAGLLAGRATEDDTRLKALEQKFLQRAEQKLDLGATLPPEFQAELIRSGLETAGTTGVGSNRAGPLGQLLGRRIGSAQLELERAREAEALALASGAQRLGQNRLNILKGIAPELQNINISRANVAGNILGLASAGLPTSAGLGGRDVLSLIEANRDLRNKQMLALADLEAQGHLAAGETASGYLGAGTSALTGLLGGGAGGLGGLNLGSLLGGQTSYIPTGQAAGQSAASLLNLGGGARLA